MKPDFTKSNGLIPAIIQDAGTGIVLMLGYMNEEAWKKTQEEKRVCFYSRSKNRLWTKGETSGHFLLVQQILLDCDADTLLIKAIPQGPVCHTGEDTCWGEKNDTKEDFIHALDALIQQRKSTLADDSYTASLLKKGINKVAQKVGEEAVELVIEAKDNNADLFINEAADLLYHYLVLLAAKDHSLHEVEECLRKRHAKK